MCDAQDHAQKSDIHQALVSEYDVHEVALGIDGQVDEHVGDAGNHSMDELGEHSLEWGYK